MDFNGAYPTARGLGGLGDLGDLSQYETTEKPQKQQQQPPQNIYYDDNSYQNQGPQIGSLGGGYGGYPPNSMMRPGPPNGQYPPRGDMMGGLGHGAYLGSGGPGSFGPNEPQPLQRTGTMNTMMDQNDGPPSPGLDGGFGGAFPSLNGKSRQTDFDTEADIMAKMNNLSMGDNNKGSAPKRSGFGFSFSRGEKKQVSHSKADSSGSIDFDINAGLGFGGENSQRGPYDVLTPSRSITLPVSEILPLQQRSGPQGSMPPPQRQNMMGMSGPMGLHTSGPMGHGSPMRNFPMNAGAQIQRPSTASSNRPSPQRIYPGYGPPGGPQQLSAVDNYRQSGYGQFDAALSDYYGSVRMSNPEYGGQMSAMNFGGNGGMGNGLGGMGSLSMQDGYGNGPMPPRQSIENVANSNRDLKHTKSQPNLRNPMDMPGDVPPMPTNFQPFPGGPPGPPQVNMGPSMAANMGPQMGDMGMQGNMGPPNGITPNMGYSGNPVPNQQSGGLGPNAHPVPMRPGLMNGSMVNIDSKPVPARSYGGGAAPAPVQPPQQMSLQQHMQQQLAPILAPIPPGASEPVVPVTAEELDRLRATIKANPSDQSSALKFAKRLVEAADVLIPPSADLKTKARTRDRYLTDAQKVLKKLATSGQNPDAMFFLADCLGRGLWSGQPDNKEAFTLYQSAAKLGHGAAAYRTAVCCEIGHEDGGGTKRDPLKAMQWYKRAAMLGDTPAMYKVGMIMLKGLLGQKKDPREAVGWLKRAAQRADAENPHALHELGLLYETAGPNDSIIRDEAYAFSLFKQAAELGYKFSQFRLGCAFEYGLMGCPIDARQSIMWYSKAAQQEEHQSELALSGWYLTGSEGVLGQSDTEAYLWARKAAMAGLAKAEYAMGYFTEVGIGVPANMEDAKRWYWRAAAQDFPKARERLEDLKRAGKNGPRQRERISRSNMNTQQAAADGECSVM